MSMLRYLCTEYDKRWGEKSGGILQSFDELQQLMDELGSRHYKKMAEIGSYRGGTVWLYAMLFGGLNCKFTIIDIKIHPIIYEVIKELKSRMAIEFEIIESPSHLANFGTVDFLHIDADHRYHMVKRDYETHYNKVNPGGVIVLHDTLLDEGWGRNKSGIPKFRKELEASGANIKTFGGTIMLCDCFGPNKSNPDKRSIGISMVYK